MPSRALSSAPTRQRRAARRPYRALAAGLLLVLLAAAGFVAWRRIRHGAPAVTAGVGENPTEARLRRAVAARPNDPAACEQLGRYYEDQSRPFEAIAAYAEARRLAPANPELPLRLAAVLRAAGAVDPARDQLTAALQAHPDHMALRIALADLWLSTAAPRQAAAVLQQRQAAVWQNDEALVTLGRARQASGDDAGAQTAFEQALSLNAKDDGALYRLGRLYLRQRQSEKARDAFFHAMFDDQRRPDYPFYAGMAYLQEPGPRSLDRALRFFRNTLNLDSQYDAAHYQAGVALARLGKPSPALTQFSLATVGDPSYAEPLPALSRGLAAVGRTPDARHFMGRYYDLKDRPAAAIREYQKMQAAAPADVEPALLIGQVYLRTRQNDKALAVTEAALQRHPHDPELLERRAVLAINRGDWPTARAVLQRWLAADPKAARACWLRGRCEIGAQNNPEAIRWLEKANTLEPHNPHFLAFLGAALMKDGTPASRQRAAGALAESVDRAPDEAEYHDLYGQALQALGRDEAALQQFLRALDADPTRIAAYLAATQLAARLQQPGAADFFPQMLRAVQRRVNEEDLLSLNVWLHPADAVARLKLAHFLTHTGQLTRARDELEPVATGQTAPPEARALMQMVQRALEVQ